MPSWLALPDVPIYVLLAVPCVIVLAYTIFGATGFGSSIIAVPLLAHAFPLSFSVPLVTTVDAFAAPTATVRQRRHVAWREFFRLLPTMLVGMAVGGTLMVNLPRTPAVFALGVFVTAYGGYVLRGPRALSKAPVWVAWPIGFIGGIFSVLFGTGGPIYIIFLSSRIADKGALRATAALVVTTGVLARVVVFIGTGLLLNAPLLLLGFLMLPAMVIGLKLGNRLHDRLSGAGVLRLIAGLLLVNGVTLIARALAEWHVV